MPAVDANSSAPTPHTRRYPGVRPFEEGDAAQFFGREQATDILLLRVLSVRLLLQFAPSGAGKTSLLRAGLFPRLRERGYFPVAVRLNDANETVREAVARALRDGAAAAGLLDPVVPAEATSLAELLAKVELWSAEVQRLTPVLVFDQFEEVFTLRDEAFRQDLAQEIGALASGRATRDGQASSGNATDLRIIISLREEYLGKLEQMSDAIPGLFHERLRLSPLSAAEARAAMVEPARLAGSWWSPTFEFDAACLNELIDFIDGVSARVRVIEPLTLQLVCQQAELIARGRDATAGQPLTLDDFGGAGGLRRLVHEYYEQQLAKLASRAARRRARRMFEEDLLDPSGKRLMLEQDEIEQGNHLRNEDIEILVDARLLRREPRGESVFYEISHDSLAAVIAGTRPQRLPKWARRLAAVLVVALALASAAAVVIYGQNRKIEAARADTATAVGVLLGDKLVERLKEAGLSDALKVVVAIPNDPDANPYGAALLARRRGELAMERATLGVAASYFERALGLSAQAQGAAGDTPALDAERAQEFKLSGDVLIEQGQVAQAKARYVEAVRLWERALASKRSPAGVFNTVDAYFALGAAREREGDLAQSEADYLKAMEQLLPLLTRAYQRVQEDPSKDTFELGRALQLYSDGSLLLARLWWTQRAEFSGARALAVELLRVRPASVQARIRLATASAVYGSFEVPGEGDAWKWKGKDERSPELGARALLDESARLLEEVTGSDQKNLRMQRERAAVAVLGAELVARCIDNAKCKDSLYANESSMAEFTLLDALASFQQLASRDPSSTDLKGDVAWALETQASLASARGDRDAALVALDKALELRHRVVIDPRDLGARSAELTIMGVKARVLVDAKRTDEALRLLDDALAGATALPEGVTRMSSQRDLLRQKAALLESLQRKEEAAQLIDQAEALSASIGEPWSTRSERALALDTEAVALHDAVASDARDGQALEGEAASTAMQGRAARYRAAASKYREALRHTPVDAVIWDNLANACRATSNELFSAQRALTEAGIAGIGEKLSKQEETALRCAFESAWLAWVLDNDVVAADKPDGQAHRLKRLKTLYENRRSLAMFLRDHAGAEGQQKALALAAQGVRDAQSLAAQVAANTSEEKDVRFLMADAYYGLGMMRQSGGIDGWEPAFRTAIGHGERLREIEPDAHAHRRWLGDVHREFARRLAQSGRDTESAAERALAKESCAGALELATNDAERTAAHDCIDDAEAGPAH